MPMPFPGATGKGLKIAVIDSGVNADHPHIIARTSGVVVGAEDNSASCWKDVLGHGTAVTAAIQEKAPDADYLAVKLFNRTLTTDASSLVRAVEWAIDNGMDLVNLSLGASGMAAKPVFELLIRRARQTGVILVCARYGNRSPMLPGILEGVISVDVDWQMERNAYRINSGEGDRYYFASGFPRPLPGVPRARNLNGISFAVANMSGFVARAMERTGSRSIEEMHKALTSGALQLQA